MTTTVPSEVAYLRSLDAVHDRCEQLFRVAEGGNLYHWDYHPERVGDVVEFCVKLIKRDYPDPSKIPPTSRRTHFDPPPIPRIPELLSQLPQDPPVRAGTLIDLYLVSVLLDAGAGPDWAYIETGNDGQVLSKVGRSEGLAIASWHMFMDGVFSSDPANKLQVDAKALKALTVDALAAHLQVSKSNPMSGMEGRCNLLIKLGSALEARRDICPTGRPGDMLKYLESKMTSPKTLELSLFWSTLFELLLPIWPSRTTLPSNPTYALGDVWPCPSLAKAKGLQQSDIEQGSNLIPFHKLTQWLSYSLVDAIEGEAGWKVERGKGQTVLPEYRNGGLLVDLGAISIKRHTLPQDAFPEGTNGVPLLAPSHPAIVEWRALTISILHRAHQLICEELSVDLTLAQVIEAATWKGGREIAKEKRAGGGPPINIISDGTVF